MLSEHHGAGGFQLPFGPIYGPIAAGDHLLPLRGPRSLLHRLLVAPCRSPVALKTKEPASGGSMRILQVVVSQIRQTAWSLQEVKRLKWRQRWWVERAALLRRALAKTELGKRTEEKEWKRGQRLAFPPLSQAKALMGCHSETRRHWELEGHLKNSLLSFRYTGRGTNSGLSDALPAPRDVPVSPKFCEENVGELSPNCLLSRASIWRSRLEVFKSPVSRPPPMVLLVLVAWPWASGAAEGRVALPLNNWAKRGC